MSAVVRSAALDEFTINYFDITDADLADSRRDRAVPGDQADPQRSGGHATAW
jgi:hypothetical protein